MTIKDPLLFLHLNYDLETWHGNLSDFHMLTEWGKSMIQSTCQTHFLELGVPLKQSHTVLASTATMAIALEFQHAHDIICNFTEHSRHGTSNFLKFILYVCLKVTPTLKWFYWEICFDTPHTWEWHDKQKCHQLAHSCYLEFDDRKFR